MITKTKTANLSADPAAIFATALSLWQVHQERAASDPKMDLSESYNGMDQFMRELMRVAQQFEMWACAHIDFNETNEVWPYLLQDRFGEACLSVLGSKLLSDFDDADCLSVAIRLRLPIRLDSTLPIPIEVRSPNPSSNSLFRDFQIRTFRDSNEYGDPTAFTSEDDPFDPKFGHPYFSLFGLDTDGLFEHIANRKTYPEIVRLAEKLAPGVQFPDSPTSCD